MVEINIEEAWQNAKNKYSFPKGLQLKLVQTEILKCILEGKDCFVNFPTGFEKSLCYMLPPLFHLNSLTRPTQVPFFHKH